MSASLLEVRLRVRNWAMLLGLICCWVGLMLGGSPAWAFQVSPMSYELAPAGSEASQTLRVRNDYDRPLAIEVSALRRDMGESGQLTQAPADEDFLLFPPQVLIEPGATQAIRVQYVGDPNLTQSTSYTVAVRQLPVGLEEGTSGVEVVFNFGTAAHIIPPNANAQLQVDRATVNTEKGELLAVVDNTGNRLANMSDYQWLITDDAGNTLELEGEALTAALENGVIFPGKRRQFHLKLDQDTPLADGPATLRIQETR